MIGARDSGGFAYLSSGNSGVMNIGALDTVIAVRVRMTSTETSYYINGSSTAVGVDTSVGSTGALAYIQNASNNQHIEQFYGGNDNYQGPTRYFFMTDLMIVTGA
jgi:hypothetical protein